MCFFEREMSLVIFWSIPIDIPASKIIRQFYSNCRRHLRPYYVSLISVFSCSISILCWRLKIFPLLVKLINLKLWQITIINSCTCFYSFHQDFSPVFIIMIILMSILLKIQEKMCFYAIVSFCNSWTIFCYSIIWYVVSSSTWFLICSNKRSYAKFNSFEW